MPPALNLRARAHAKINLGLKILRRRRDGFHELRTVFQTIALADRVELDFQPGGRAAVALEVAGEAPAGEDNLAYRAARLAADAYRLRGRLAIRLTKRIPQRAGLGGGSSDAAAVLRMAAHLAGRAATPRRQLELAAELGSDVAPFLLGGTVLGLGRGEEVYGLPDLPPWRVVLAMPRDGAGVATPEAFRAWDRSHPGLTAAGEFATIMEFCSLLEQVLPAFRAPHSGRNRGRLVRPTVHAGIENDFQAGVFSLSPDFPRIHRQLRQGQAAWVSLTGSGAAQFGLFARAEPALRTAARLQRRYQVWSSRFVGRSEFHRGLTVETK